MSNAKLQRAHAVKANLIAIAFSLAAEHFAAQGFSRDAKTCEQSAAVWRKSRSNWEALAASIESNQMELL